MTDAVPTESTTSGSRTVPLRLWLISQTENNNYDTYSDAVVAAATEDEARHTHPEGCYTFGSWKLEWEDEPRTGWGTEEGYCNFDSSWSQTLEGVSVTLIGDAAEGVKPGPVCASFHAG